MCTKQGEPVHGDNGEADRGGLQDELVQCAKNAESGPIGGRVDRDANSKQIWIHVNDAPERASPWGGEMTAVE